MPPEGRHNANSGGGKPRDRLSPIGRVLMIVLLVGLLWLVGKGILALWRILSAGL